MCVCMYGETSRGRSAQQRETSVGQTRASTPPWGLFETLPNSLTCVEEWFPQMMTFFTSVTGAPTRSATCEKYVRVGYSFVTHWSSESHAGSI